MVKGEAVNHYTDGAVHGHTRCQSCETCKLVEMRVMYVQFSCPLQMTLMLEWGSYIVQLCATELPQDMLMCVLWLHSNVISLPLNLSSEHFVKLQSGA